MPDLVLPFDTLLAVIGASVLCGGLVGLERQLQGKPAGVRTSVLICMGSALFIRIGASLHIEGVDATRVLGHLVVGIGFLGAGVIMNRAQIVRGMTSAAVIWILAVLGALVGFGAYAAAFAVSVATVVVLVGVRLVERAVPAMRSGVHARQPAPAESGSRSAD